MDLPFESAKPVQPQDVLQAGRNITKDVQNTMAITLFVYPKFFVLEPNTKTTKIGKKLIIEKAKCRITELDLHELPSAEQYEQKKTFSGFLGIITIIDKAFLMFVEECNQVCTLENSDIFLINSLAFIPFENENEIFAQTVGNNYIAYIENIRKLFLPGYYFSYTYDLSLSKAAQQTRKTPDPRFVWNSYLCKELTAQKIDRKWIVPLIQGYVGHFTVYLMGKKLDYYLISRRSRNRGGTRYNARGIDDDGNVANFVESEQIIYYNDFCCSHVQVRGSVPVFWAQRGLTAAMRVTRTYEYTNEAFLKHMNFLNSTYGRVLFVNLMSLTKTGEQLITDALEEQIKRSELPTLRYEFFDFHYACKNQRFDRVNPLLKKLHPINENFKFYAEDRAKNVLLTQKGVIRSNCLDCLDRTNVFQSKVAIKMFEAIMKNLGVDLIAALGQDVLSLIDNDDPKAQHPFILNFKIVWADNGDQISRHYAGTGSTISSVTRYGKGGLMGLLSHGMTTLNRFYIGNWEDQTKQECIDMILGEHTDIVNLFGENLDRELKLRQKEFCAFDKLGLFVCTWNVNGAPPHNGIDTSKLLDFGGQANPDLIVISLQEIVVLNATNVLMASNEHSVNQWVNFFTERLRKIDKNYTLVLKKDLVGLLMIIFAHERVKNRINKVNSETARAGMMNTLGNKGAVVVKFHFDDTSMVFLNCHLPADDATVTDRIAVIDDIHKNTFQAETLGKKKEERIALLDYKFLMGDMNFRTACSNQEARHLVDCYNQAVEAGNQQQAEDMLKTLFSFDELNQFRKNSEFLANYDEPKINFLPTYKYDVGTNVYDTSKKQRTPAWCDRILLWADDTLKHEQPLYARRELMESDHRPVVTYVTLDVKKVDQSKKEEIEKQVYEVLKAKPMEDLGIEEVCAIDANGPLQANAVLAEPADKA